MTSIEQRVDEAVSDVAGMLNDGSPVEEALESCAREHGLKAEVLELRAQKCLGDLGSFRERNQRQAKIFATERKVDSAERRYLAERPDVPFLAWFEAETGSSATKSQVKKIRKHLARRIATDLDPEIDDAPNP